MTPAILLAAAMISALPQGQGGEAPTGIYQCQGAAETAAGPVRTVIHISGETGRRLGAWALWQQEPSPSGSSLAVRWNLDPATLLARTTELEIEVPLVPKIVAYRSSLRLSRPPGSSRDDMSLTGPISKVLHSPDRASAYIALDSLLAYGTGVEELHWSVAGSGRRGRLYKGGTVPLGPLRDALAALPRALADAAAKQTRYATDCEPDYDYMAPIIHH